MKRTSFTLCFACRSCLTDELGIHRNGNIVGWPLHDRQECEGCGSMPSNIEAANVWLSKAEIGALRKRRRVSNNG